MKNTIFIIGAILFSINTLYSQSKYPTDYFRNPLEIPIILAGTFGELRTAHFHSGIDIKTQRKVGLNVHTAAEGYISRIKISNWGYGKALYITHPNGYTSVYAHLSKFNKNIEAYIKKRQYRTESFETQAFPRANELKVSKDEIIAFSGNSGSSSAPHLHFEIRSSKTEKIINPMLFGLIPSDTKKPNISHLRAYVYGDSSHVNLSNINIPINIKKLQNGLYKASSINAYGKIGFGINTYDMLDGALNKNGVYQIEMFVNGKTYYKHKLETFSFSESKYLDLLIDYPYYATYKRKYQKTHIHPLSRLQIFQKTKEKGYLNIKDKKDYTVKIVVSDFIGNKATIDFNIKGKKAISKIKKKTETTPYYIEYNKKASFKKSYVKIDFPKNSFYENFYLNFKVADSIVTIHKPKLPIHRSYTLSFNVSNLPDSIKEQSYIANIVNKKYYNYRSTIKNDSIFKTTTKTLGQYTLRTDKKNPEIYKCSFYNNQKLTNYRYLSIHAKDTDSGLKSFRGEIDGKWVLMEYNTKTHKFTYDFNDKKLKPGKHLFTFVVKDNVNNTTEYSSTFYIK